MSARPLGEICEFKYGSALPERARQAGKVLVFGSNGQVGFHSESLTDGPTVIVGRKGSVGKVAYCDESCWPIDTTYFVDGTCTEHDLRWLYYALESLDLGSLNKATGVPGLNREDAYRKTIFLPPLDEQRRIAAILEQADSVRQRQKKAPTGRLVRTNLSRLDFSKIHFLPIFCAGMRCSRAIA